MAELTYLYWPTSNPITTLHLNIVEHPMFDSGVHDFWGPHSWQPISAKFKPTPQMETSVDCFIMFRCKGCLKAMHQNHQNRIQNDRWWNRSWYSRQIWPTVAEITKPSNGCDWLKAKRNDKPWRQKNQQLQLVKIASAPFTAPCSMQRGLQEVLFVLSNGIQTHICHLELFLVWLNLPLSPSHKKKT